MIYPDRIYIYIYTWIFETAQIIAFSGKNAVTAFFSKDGVFCCDEAHAGRTQKETASLSVQTASLGVQTASFPVHGFCTTHKTAFFFDYGVFSLKNASGKNLCRLKIQVCIYRYTVHNIAGRKDCSQESFYKMPGAGCQRGCVFIKCLGPESHHQISVKSRIRRGRGNRFAGGLMERILFIECLGQVANL